jgi:serine/threonine protein kinase
MRCEIMTWTIGTHLGAYESTALLGKGGMGEVYRARDSKLKRDVAIKILPEEFSNDPERVGRFQREAEALALLNHDSQTRPAPQQINVVLNWFTELQQRVPVK